MEKITALIFGLLGLVLEVWLTLTKPSVESIVAAVFCLIIVITMIALIIKDKKRIVTLVEGLPKGNRPVDKGMKFVNEIAPYIKEKDGKIFLKIIL